MNAKVKLTRRGFLKSAALATAASGLGDYASAAGPEPPRIGIRAASMKMVGTPDVFQAVAGIPGIRGVELQTTAGSQNLRDWDNVRRYKQNAQRWGLTVTSLAGVWDRGVNIRGPKAADNLIATVRAAEMLEAGVILAAFFKNDAPNMNEESSYGPIVEMLRKTTKSAADAGVIIGLENSLSPADNRRLVDLIDHPAIGVYYDPFNMHLYGHGDQAISGIKLLGKDRICSTHVKNGNKLIEAPGPIDWPAAFRACGEIGYAGWYVYETEHESTADCIEDTKKNNLFLERHIAL